MGAAFIGDTSDRFHRFPQSSAQPPEARVGNACTFGEVLAKIGRVSVSALKRRLPGICSAPAADTGVKS
jgi:hypothetical protein